jgi:hypothetical protein
MNILNYIILLAKNQKNQKLNLIFKAVNEKRKLHSENNL